MPHFESSAVAYLFYALSAIIAVVLLWVGYRLGRMIQGAAASRVIASKEQDLFTAQKGFKNLYEQEVGGLKAENAALRGRIGAMEAKVEAYRRKAAGFGGLFSTSHRRAEAMYALLLENETLEEALMRQNEKLTAERADALHEQFRSTSYRRALLGQLLADDRVKPVVSEILADEKRLPEPAPDAEKPGER